MDECQPGSCAMDGQDERRGKAAEKEVRDAVVAPVGAVAAPAERDDAVEAALEQRRRAVTRRRQIGQQARVPEEERDREVRRHRDDVPRERRAELRPHPHLGGVRDEPVGEPRASQMQDGKAARLNHREERHPFGESVDRRPPAHLEEQEDGRDERPGMTDPDPPDEVDDREGPRHGDVVPP